MRLKILGCAIVVCGAAPVSFGGLINGANISSPNWSGYAAIPASNDSFTGVEASWVVPTVRPTPGQDTYSAFWVGLDGLTNGTVEQIGVSADESSGGTPTYFAWWELYPQGSNNINLQIEPGDTITALVQYDPSQNSTNGMGQTEYAYELEIADSRDGSNPVVLIEDTTDQGQGASAEWIAEAPELDNGGNITQATLADYGNVKFSNLAFATSDSATSASAYSIEMNQNGEVVSEPTAINNDSFSINYVPEPASLGVLGFGGVLMLGRTKGRRA
jgi:hypothetical protein